MKKTAAPEPAAPLSPGLRRYLYFTAGVTGGAVMVIEILGAKMLAPYFGTSHFVWTAQIAVTLVALAAGYYAGGRLVDRSPRLGKLYEAILAAAVYLAVTVLVVEPVAYSCLDFKLAIGSLSASVFLFFVPLALLAMVGPFVIRVLTVAVAGVGGNVGRLTAISTFGSFLGTVLIGYVLIPFLPNSVSMYATAGVLMAVAAGYFFGWGQRRASALPVVASILLGGLLGGIGVASDRPGSGVAWQEVYRANSSFGRLQVISGRDGARRFFVNDLLIQNIYDPQQKASTATFTYLLEGLARGYRPRLDDVLCIGMGVGAVPMSFARGGARVDVVEINPGVVPLARQFFDFDASAVQLTIDDGRHFVNRSTRHYDAIVLDAFLGDSSPSHLMSRQAFTEMRRSLKPGGVVVINTLGELGPGKDFFPASLSKTLGAVFRSVRVHASGAGNVFFVASDQPSLELRETPRPETVHEDCRRDVMAAYAGIVTTDPTHGRVLTDDYNPVEYYDAANREETRRALVMNARSQ